MAIPSLYQSPEAARVAPRLSDGPKAFRRFDLRHGLVVDRGPKASRIRVTLLLAILAFVVVGWLVGWLDLTDLP